MVKEVQPSTNEKQFILQALDEGLRVDGRGVHDVRKISFALGPQSGHAEVRLGKTRVTANVSCEIIRPRQNQATEGTIQFNTDFSPMASPTFDAFGLSEEEVLVSRLLEKALKQSRAIDLEGLCIVAGEKVWQLRVDLRVLDHEGNIVDCACMAAVAALLHFKRPDVTVIGDEVTVHTIEERSAIPLSVHHIPVCVSFAFFSNGERQVVDPSLVEEQVRECDMTFVVNKHREICTLSKAGGTPIAMEQILNCANIAAAKAEEVTNLIKEAVAKVGAMDILEAEVDLDTISSSTRKPATESIIMLRLFI
ncbi:ribosomal protein S5 domain 2-type protein [Phlyctochytrium arcticum]|nr:ribosomal protein S5 domain 2-type protein [Phlyctochytrium arcticum]